MQSISSYRNGLSNILTESEEMTIIDKLDIVLSKLKTYEDVISFILAQVSLYESYNPMSADSQAFFHKNKNGFEALLGKQRTRQLFGMVIDTALIDKSNSVDMESINDLLNSKLDNVRSLISRIENDARELPDIQPETEDEQVELETPEIIEPAKEETPPVYTDKLLSRFKKALQQYVRKSFTNDIETISKLNKNILDAALSNFTNEEKEILQSMME